MRTCWQKQSSKAAPGKSHCMRVSCTPEFGRSQAKIAPSFQNATSTPPLLFIECTNALVRAILKHRKRVGSHVRAGVPVVRMVANVSNMLHHESLERLHRKQRLLGQNVAAVGLCCRRHLECARDVPAGRPGRGSAVPPRGDRNERCAHDV